jgi:hypothetical protein
MAPKQADVAALIAEYHQAPHFGLSQIEVIPEICGARVKLSVPPSG